jgi:hypothetical protein
LVLMVYLEFYEITHQISMKIFFLFTVDFHHEIDHEHFHPNKLVIDMDDIYFVVVN